MIAPLARRRVLLAATTALLLLTAPAAMGVSPTRDHAPVGSQLVSYTGIADAPGIGIHGIYMGVSLDVPEVHSALTTGGVGAGLASIAWPGDIGGNAGTAVLVLSPTAPEWVKILNDPVKAETHSTGTRHAINKTIPGTVMESNASHKLVTATSKTQAAVPGLGSLGVFSGSSSAKLVGPHTIRAVARSAVTDLNLAGGLIKIGSLVSDAVVVSNGKTTRGHAKTTVAGVTIAGIPVSIDRDGIHLADSVLPTDAVTKLLTQTLKALHLKVTFTPSLISRDGGAASYNSGALVLTYAPNHSTYSITLGRAAAQVNATPSLLPGEIGTPATTHAPPSAPGTSTGGGSTDLPSGSDVGIGSGDEPSPSLAPRVVGAAKDILLAGGPTGLMVFGLIVAMIASGLLLPRIAGRFLDAPVGADCEDDR
jgi:hypothetical protein